MFALLTLDFEQDEQAMDPRFASLAASNRIYMS